MNQLLLATVLLSATADIEDGSLLVLENSNKPVIAYTKSTITHVAVILLRDDMPWVYEATPAKVRRVRLASYYDEIAELDARRKDKTRVWLLQPKRPYAAADLKSMKTYMESQLDRRYSVKGYVRGKQSDGIHCAEFASSALAKTSRFEFDEQHHAISPAELYRHVKHQHGSAKRIAMPEPKIEESWCSGAWRQCFSFREWCVWASYETWMFCR
jgi:hypothetical protein